LERSKSNKELFWNSIYILQRYINLSDLAAFVSREHLQGGV